MTRVINTYIKIRLSHGNMVDDERGPVVHMALVLTIEAGMMRRHVYVVSGKHHRTLGSRG